LGEDKKPDERRLKQQMMGYSREFFALNVDFARKVNEVSGIPYEQAILRYTNLYIRCGIGHTLDPRHPTWLEFLQGISHTEQDVEWAFQFAVRRQAQPDLAVDEKIFGCFSFSEWGEKRVRLHFHNRERSSTSPLSHTRIARRLEELRAMTGYLYQQGHASATMVGGSWLYNIEAYRRLFPPAFLASARPGKEDYPFMTLWGQFLQRNGQVRPGPASQFSASLKRAASLDDVLSSFPLKVYYLEAPMQVFYDYYMATQPTAG
jgi:hypothetical protein